VCFVVLQGEVTIMLKKWAVSILLALFSGLASALPVSGALTSADGGGIFATGSWDDGGATLHYTVTELPNGTWQYDYHFVLLKKKLSHIIFEVSKTFTKNNVLDGTTSGWSLGNWGMEGNSNPGIPSELYGLKFDGPFSLENSITIISNREPMWGDFYAKDGVDGVGRDKVDVYAYNTSYGLPSDGYLPDGTKILVPDTKEGGGNPNIVPEPTSAALLGLGLLGLTTLRRKKDLPVV